MTVSNFVPYDPIVDYIWREKYRWAEGNEQSIEDSFKRVVSAVYEKDTRRDEFMPLVLEAMINREWNPAGRIHASAGTDHKTTSLNCFVSGTIDDSMADIMEKLKEAALTMQQGGGIGFDFSTLRPKGAIVKATGSTSSGPISFMKMFDSMCQAILSGSSRRGAMMAVMADDHPDIFEFITAKQKSGILLNFNMSVLVTSKLMTSVKSGGVWELGFGIPPVDLTTVVSVKEKNGKPWYVYKVLPAVELWDAIMTSTYSMAEPGVIFIDEINSRNNLKYSGEVISATNPCFSADTLIITNNGAKPIKKLVGKLVTIWDGTSWVDVDNFRVTGNNQPMLKVTLYDGSSLRVTTEHSFYLDNGTKLKAKDLKVGHRLELATVEYNGTRWEPAAYLKGFLVGDGHTSTRDSGKSRLNLFLYEPKHCCASRLIESASELEVGAVNTNAEVELGFSVSPSMPTKWQMSGLTVRNNDGRLDNWASKYKSRLPRYCFSWDYATKCEFLAGLFDADGTVKDSKTNGFGYQLSSVEKGFLIDIQTLLKSLGVNSKLGLMKAACYKDMPGGNYYCQESWRLGLSQIDSINLAKQVEFSRLKNFSNKTVSNRLPKPKYSKVVSIEPDGIDKEVYCCTVKPHHKVALAVGITTGNCGEEPLPPYGTCDLGAINLLSFVREPFTKNASFDLDRMKKVASLGVRFLDNVLDITNWPLLMQEEESDSKRRIGAGFLGLASALQALGLRYGSSESLDWTKSTLKTWRDTVYHASAELAVERGAFPLYSKGWCDNHFFKDLPKDTQKLIRKTGIRNAVLQTCAPNGTTSLYYGNVSSGLEPTFSFRYYRKVRQLDESFKEFAVCDRGWQLYCSVNKLDPVTASLSSLPNSMVTALELTVDEHLAMQAACQTYIDAAVSKTVNCPESITFDEFKSVYMTAYDTGCKGVTTYRPNPNRGSILSVTSEAVTADELKALPQEEKVTKKMSKNGKPERPDVLEGKSYKIKWGVDSSRAYYITINNIISEDGKVLPFELFVNTKAVESLELIVALTRMISGIFRRSADDGTDASFVIEELLQTHSPQGGQWVKGKYIPSLTAYIGIIIHQHLQSINYHDTSKDRLVNIEQVDSSVKPKVLGEICPKCQQPSLIRKEGCQSCLDCGYSKCG